MTDQKSSSCTSEKFENRREHLEKTLDERATTVPETATTTNPNAHVAYTDSRDDIKTTTQDLTEVAVHTYENFTKTAKEQYENLSQKAIDQYERVKDRATNVASEYKAHFDDLVVSSEEYIRNKPIQTVGITFLAGLILGLLLQRRR